MATKVKSLNLFNLDEIIERHARNVLGLSIRYNIENKNDLFSLLAHGVLTDILEIYKKNEFCFVVFYLSTTMQNLLLEDGGVIRGINCKGLNILLTRKIRFSIVVSSLQFDDLCKLLLSSSSKYQEIIEKYKFIHELIPEIVKACEKLKFFSLSDDLKERLLKRIGYVLPHC